ncbi:hypothetical protein PYCCODRAFT_1474564 [Trametes coccinea BRFM310]|uniref:C2 domain-containing protein n=1 Tax=Trametes coccinea (strain BRFM310) TaxID=1353009 RepID=A0A1Y2IZ64_TRAC3|nr:hypothetical protein PYCCODRAFT_1474564 [Trametes coccinea BRFM310]
MGTNNPEEEIGTLVVVVLKARNLRDKHTLYKQDAFAQATLNKVTKKTQVDVKGGQHPVWDEELRFPVSKRASDETRKLEVSCWSKEPRTDECVGRGEVDITETLKTGEFDDWVPLKLEDGSNRGELYLEMTYYAKTPPLQRRASKWKPSERLARPTTANADPDVPPLPTSAQGAPAAHTSAAPASVPSSIPPGLQPGAAPRVRPVVGQQHAHSAPHRSPVRRHDGLPPLPEEASVAQASIPAILRPGAGPSRTSPGTSPRADELLLPPDPPLHTHAPPPPPRDPSPPLPAPFESVPPYLRVGGGHTPIPEPHVPASQAYPPPIQQYPPVSQPYAPPAQAYAAQPYPYSTPPPRHTLPPQPYGSPPRQYAPPPQPAYIPPAPTYSSYAYAPPPPVAEDPAVDDLPDPYLQVRYSTPLPLPNDAPAKRTAGPSSSYQPAPPPNHQTTASKPAPPPQTTSPPPLPKDRHISPARRPAAATQARVQGRTREEEERDRLLALQLEKEEEERQRKLREQEERDEELARQLDLELNLERENATREASEGGHAPGAW